MKKIDGDLRELRRLHAERPDDRASGVAPLTGRPEQHRDQRQADHAERRPDHDRLPVVR